MQAMENNQEILSHNNVEHEEHHPRLSDLHMHTVAHAHLNSHTNAYAHTSAHTHRINMQIKIFSTHQEDVRTQGIVVHTLNLSTWEAKAGRSEFKQNRRSKLCVVGC